MENLTDVLKNLEKLVESQQKEIERLKKLLPTDTNLKSHMQRAADTAYADSKFKKSARSRAEDDGVFDNE